MNLVEPVGHEPERFAETRFQRLLQLLVDCGAHFVELPRIVVAQRIEPLLEGRADRFETLGERAQLLVLRRRRACQLLLRRPGELAQPLADLRAQPLRSVGVIASRRSEVELQVALEILSLRLENGELGRNESCLRLRRRNRTQTPQRDDHQDDEDGQH